MQFHEDESRSIGEFITGEIAASNGVVPPDLVELDILPDPDRPAVARLVKSMKDLRDFGYHGELDLCRPSNPTGQWVFTEIAVTRDARLIEESNWGVISEDMLERFPETCEVVRCSDWAYGWIDHLAVRAYDQNGLLTPAIKAILDWNRQLEDYPLADEDDYGRREWESMEESIDEQVGYLMNYYYNIADDQEKVAGAVSQWLRDNNDRAFENADDQGYVDEDYIREALDALYPQESEDED